MTNQFLSVSEIFRDASAPARFFFVVFITISCFLIFGFISIILAMPIFGLSFLEINNLIKDSGLSADTNLFKYFQATQSISLFIVPALILNYLLFNPPQRFINNHKRIQLKPLFIIVIIMVFSLPIIDILSQFNSMINLPSQVEDKLMQFENEASDLTDKLLSGSSSFELLVNIFIIALIPALGEEFMFRGIIQKIFHEWQKNIHLAIIISAVLFSAIHMQFYGFIPRFILGLFFGYLYYWGGNIWLPVIAHFLNNFIAILIHFLTANNLYELPAFLSNSEKISGMVYLLSAIVISILLIVLRKNYLKHPALLR